MKKIILSGIFVFMAFSASAQARNHVLWLPSSPATWENVYFALGGNVNIPATFSGDKKLTSWGGGGTFEMGYDADGWLLGVRYTFSAYAKKGGDEYLMDSFVHNIIALEVSKILTKGNTMFLPEWLDVRVQIGAGCDIISAEYYKSLDAKNADVKTESVQPAVIFNAGLFVENDFGIATPFLGMNCDFMPDTEGIFFLPSITAGIRLTLGM